MAAFTIVGGDLVLPDRILERASITIRDGLIADIGGPAPPGAETIAADGNYVLPGLIDLHTHGRLFNLDPPALPAALAQDSLDNARGGVTRFLPTLASAPVAAWLAALPVLERALAGPVPGAVPLGLHLEGIFINPAAAGAHALALIRPFNDQDPEHRAIIDRYGGVIRLATLAPEVPGNERLLERLRGRGIVASLGHSTASPDQVREFMRHGIVHITHLFNGMKGVHHRDPGPALAGLVEDGLSVELICDGYHVHPDAVRLAHRCKPRAQRILVTDSVMIDLPGIVAGGVDEPNRLPGGGFAGSRLRLASAVRNYVRFTGCPLFEAAAMASLNPAARLGLDSRLGSLAVGKVADLWIAERDLAVRAVFVEGRNILL